MSNIVLVHDKKLGDYFTFWEEDKQKFLNAMMPYNILDEWQFDIIKDEAEIGKVLRSFLSKNRGEEYDTQYTSVSVITGKLYPMSVSDIGLIEFWRKRISKDEYLDQQQLNQEAQEKGTSVHKCLENYLCDSVHHSLKDINKYIEESYDKELCYNLFYNFTEYKNKNGGNFLSFLKRIDPIYSEVFVQDDELQIQGCTDGLILFESDLTLLDFKTTSKINKKTGKRVFKPISQLDSYKRQLCLYAYLLHKQGILKNLKNLKYMINMFHLISEEYAIYHLDKEEVESLINSILIVINWFNEMKEK